MTNNTKTIVTLGLKGAGKDTYAQHIVSNNPDIDVAKVAFAMPLKECAMQVFGYSFEQVEDRVLKEQGVTFNAQEINQKVVDWTKQFLNVVGYPMPEHMKEPLAWVIALKNELKTTYNEQGNPISVTLSPRDLQRFIGSKEWLRSIEINGETPVSLYTLEKVRQHQEQNKTVIITDCRMESEVKIIGENVNENPVEYVLIIRYFTEKGIVKSYIQDDGHWTEFLNATLTDKVLNAINNPFNGIVANDTPEYWQNVQRLADTTFANQIYELCQLNEYKNISLKVHFSKQID